VLRDRHQRLLDAPTLLARADGLIELKRLMSAHGRNGHPMRADECLFLVESSRAADITAMTGFCR